MRLIIVTGLSGSGKTIALQTLEDLEYYCVDNLPAELLPAFVDTMLGRETPTAENIAVGIDARNLDHNLHLAAEVVARLRQGPVEVRILFLQADDQVLLRRYSETRRRHPLSRDGALPLAEAIAAERLLLEPLSSLADLTVDTSNTNLHELRRILRARLHDAPPQQLSVLFQSFGFKHGVPTDSDFVFDVRCLPNPHWDPQLRPLTGRDQPVVDFLQAEAEVGRMADELEGFLRNWLPSFETSNRSYLTVSIGCTGGQHRSVYLAEELSRRFKSCPCRVIVRHRELR